MLRNLAVAVVLAVVPSALCGQDQLALVGPLEQGDVGARIEAVVAAQRIAPGEVTPRLRDALRANLRWWVDRPRPFRGGGEWEGEAFLEAAGAVARLQDPATIPELILVINTGNRVPNVLAAMKVSSYPQVVALIEDPDSDPELVGGALLTLE